VGHEDDIKRAEIAIKTAQRDMNQANGKGKTVVMEHEAMKLRVGDAAAAAQRSLNRTFNNLKEAKEKQRVSEVIQREAREKAAVVAAEQEEIVGIIRVNLDSALKDKYEMERLEEAARNERDRLDGLEMARVKAEAERMAEEAAEAMAAMLEMEDLEAEAVHVKSSKTTGKITGSVEWLEQQESEAKRRALKADAEERGKIKRDLEIQTKIFDEKMAKKREEIKAKRLAALDKKHAEDKRAAKEHNERVATKLAENEAKRVQMWKDGIARKKKALEDSKLQFLVDSGMAPAEVEAPKKVRSWKGSRAGHQEVIEAAEQRIQDAADTAAAARESAEDAREDANDAIEARCRREEELEEVDEQELADAELSVLQARQHSNPNPNPNWILIVTVTIQAKQHEAEMLRRADKLEKAAEVSKEDAVNLALGLREAPKWDPNWSRRGPRDARQDGWRPESPLTGLDPMSRPGTVGLAMMKEIQGGDSRPGTVGISVQGDPERPPPLGIGPDWGFAMAQEKEVLGRGEELERAVSRGGTLGPLSEEEGSSLERGRNGFDMAATPGTAGTAGSRMTTPLSRGMMGSRGRSLMYDASSMNGMLPTTGTMVDLMPYLNPLELFKAPVERSQSAMTSFGVATTQPSLWQPQGQTRAQTAMQSAEGKGLGKLQWWPAGDASVKVQTTRRADAGELYQNRLLRKCSAFQKSMKVPILQLC